MVARPAKVAVAWSHGHLTYSDLDMTASRLALELERLGVGPEAIVPLCSEKSPWMVVAMVAVLKAGAAFVALDPGQPPSRTAAMLEQVGARVVIVSPAHRHVFEGFVEGGMETKIITLSDNKMTMPSSPEAAGWKSSSLVCPDNPAYVIFTSGSTGTPKGVVVEHGSFCSGLALHAPAQFLDEQSRVLQFAAYTHDTCLVETLTTLCMGGTVCSPSEGERTDGLADFINNHAVNWAVLTPSFVASMEPREVPTLDVVVLAGERLSQSNIDIWAESTRLLSGYGVSECSVVTTISRPAKVEQSPSNIGLPAGGVCWIVDPENVERPMPIGAVGEILIEGPTVARGYIKNLEATKRVFIEPPMWLRAITEPESGPNQKARRRRLLYRTGDLGRQNDDGTLEFVSRIDSQVKVAGRRIELGEVEHHISTHPRVRLCMVLYPRAGDHANTLIAVLELHPQPSKLDQEQEQEAEQEQQEVGDGDGALVENHSDILGISVHVRERVPEYMLPSFWFVVSGRLPRLPSAKLDRRTVERELECRKLKRNTDDELSDIIPQDNVIAQHIAREVASFGSLLEHQSTLDPDNGPPRDTPLRRMGIDSIKAITLMKSLHRHFGIKVPVASLLDELASPTSIAEQILRSRKLGQGEYLPPHIDMVAHFKRLKTYLDAKLLQALPRSSSSHVWSKDWTVLLTGAGGYLGQEILRQLLAAGLKVVVLVRASSVEAGRKRLINGAAHYWCPSYEKQVEVWLGDLSRADLGLTPECLARLSGHGVNTTTDDCIRAVIHNGARVHWSESATALWPVNVDSTVRLLKAALESVLIRKFVYVSGGAAVEGSVEDQLMMVRDGYSQTKLLGQALVQYCAGASRKRQLGLELSAVKPGFIIATPDRGVANTSDYLWRFLASAVELGVYDSSTKDAWVAVSTLPIVSAAIVSRVLSSPSPSLSLETPEVPKQGLREKDLWAAVGEVGFVLQPVDHETWIARLQGVLDARRETHLLWPLQGILEQQDYRLGRDLSKKYGVSSTDSMTEYMRRAVGENFRILVAMDFVQAPLGDNKTIGL